MSASVLAVGLAIVLGAGSEASGGVLAPGAALEKLWGEGSFTEGGALAEDGAILFSDIGDRIMRFDPATGAVTVFREPSGRANGLIFDPRGRLIAAEGANSGGGRRVSITDRDGNVRTLADRYQGKRFNSPNDVAVDRPGRVYVSDPRYVGDDPRELDFEGVFRIDPDGSVHRLETTAAKPNGLAISPDGKTLYVADTGPARRVLLALDLDAEGAVARPRILHDFGAGRGVDGLTVTLDGRIIAAAGSGPEAGVHVFDPDGKPVAFIAVPEPPTNVEFGGPDRTTLYITAGKGLYRVKTTMTGHHLGPPEALGQERREPGQATQAPFAGRIFLSCASQDDALRGVVAIDPNDGSRQMIAAEQDPRARIAPDGSRLAVRRYRLGEPDPGLWIYETAGAKESFRVSEREALPCWSPDGKEILLGALTRARGREIDYWRIAADGSREERVPIPVTEHVLDWSPDGLWLLTFSSRKLPDRPFYLMHPDGTGERVLLANANAVPEFGGKVGISGRFSPDSRKILFDQIDSDTDVRPIQLKSTALLELDVESGKFRRFFVREGGDFSTGGSWSPDGKAIAVVVTEGLFVLPRPLDAKTHVEVVDRDGRVLKTIPLPGPSLTRIVIDWR